MIWCELNIRGRRPNLFGTVYKPNHDDIQTVDNLAASLELINKSKRMKDVVLHGDFNQPNIDWE